MWVMGGDFLINERIMIKWVRKILNEKNKWVGRFYLMKIIIIIIIGREIFNEKFMWMVGNCLFNENNLYG